MSFQHYLPAAYLGRFSEDVNGPLRERKLWALRRDGHKEFGSAAGKIAGQRDMYTLKQDFGWGPDAIDDMWAKYEADLPAALEKLCDAAMTLLDAEVWLRTLIPFAVGMFVRTPEMNQRYEPTIAPLFAEAGEIRDQVNMARATAFNRFLAPVMAARWFVLHLPPDLKLLVNDCGLANIDLGKCLGWMIPVGRQELLALEPMPDGYGRDIMLDAGHRDWRAVIHHVELDTGAAAGVNDAITDAAIEMVVGGSKRHVQEQIGRFSSTRPREQLDLRMLSTNRMQLVHAFDWHRAVSAIRYAADDPRIQDFEVNFAALAEGWCPPVQVPTNLPIFNMGLSVHDKTITMGMSELPGFTDGSPPPWPWEAKATD
jgi:hypothetical protein